MSMLAERKRKQKWSLNPRGKTWAEDSSKFGQKLLEKMGWSHGKGLGAKEDGRTEHIKVAYKNDSQGMGYKESDDQWTEHESNFSELLKALGGGQQANEEIKLSSLEEKSQSSKARVHYKKFTRGKDVSKYSEKDLANIFGKKALKDAKKVKKELEKIEQELNEDGGQDRNFSNGGLISDYFKKKLPNFGKSNGFVVGNNGVLKSADDSESESERRPSFSCNQNKESESESEARVGFGFGFKSAETDNYSTAKQKKSKKKRTLEANPTDNEDTPSKKKKLEPGYDPSQRKKKNKLEKTEEIGLANPAFDPLYTPVKLERHILEPIDESMNETLNDTVGQVAENFEVQVQINNEVTPVKSEDLDSSSLKKNKKKKKKGESVCVLNEESQKIEELSLNSTLDQPTYEAQGRKKKKSKNTNQHIQEMDLSNLEEVTEQNASPNLTKKAKKKKLEISDIEKTSSNSNAIEEDSKVSSKKKKCKTKPSKEGIDNPFFNESLSLDSSASATVEDSYEHETAKKKKKKKKSDKNKENCGVENPVFDTEDRANPKDLLNEEFELRRKEKNGDKGFDNPALNLNDSIEESCDLMLNVIATPVQAVQNSAEQTLSIQSIKKSVSRRKSVRFSDVTRERIIPNKEEIGNETLDESRDIVEVQGKLNDSSEQAYLDNFVPKKKSKKRKGIENDAFDQQANVIEENITSISRVLDTYQAEIENDMNEAKMKTVEVEDIMVGEVGNPDGNNEKLPDGSVKLKFKYANFKKTSKYVEALTGSKKSYKHLIKGDIVVGFKESNLHEIDGYAVAKVD